MKILFKIGRSAQVVSSKDEGLGDQEDASKQERKIDDIHQDTEVNLIDETQGRYDDAQMFDTNVFNSEEVFVAEQSEKVIEEVVSTAEVSVVVIINTEEITLAQALVELRSVKPKIVVQKPVQSTTTTAPSIIPKEKRIIFHEQEQAPTPIVSSQQPTQVKDKGKGKMVEEEPVKKMSKKELLKLDEELAFKLQAEEEEEQARLARKKDEKVEEASISWDNVQVMIEADSLKRAGGELEQEKEKKQKIDDDQEEAEMKKLIKVVPDEEEVAIDAIPLATKPLSILMLLVYKLLLLVFRVNVAGLYKLSKTYSIRINKGIWDRVKLLMQGTSLSKQERECLAVPTFLPGDEPISCMNKAMAFLNQATVQDGRITVQQVQGRQGEEHMARQCTQPKRRMDAAWFKEKVLLVQAQAEGKELDKEQLAFQADLRVADTQVAQTITHNATFQTDDLDAYDSNCDDISSAKAVLMANLSSCDSDVLSEVPYSDTSQNDMINQSVHEFQYSELSPTVDYADNEIRSDSNIIPYSQYLEET
ncbi:hypothetical protein Tco_0367904 [Tanacetum coccineum]